MKGLLRARLEAAGLEGRRAEVFAVEGFEALSKPFRFTISLAAADPLDDDVLVGAPAALVFALDGITVRTVHGTVTEVLTGEGDDDAFETVVVELAPRLQRMSLTRCTAIYMGKSVPEIVVAKLIESGFSEAADFELRLDRSYPEREYVVQFQETDLAFISRLSEHIGIHFAFDHETGTDRLILTDDNLGYGSPRDLRVPFRGRGEHRDVFELSSAVRTVPAKVAVRDYNYRTPGTELMAKSGPADGTGLIEEYGAHFKSHEEAELFARIRREEIESGRRTYGGRSARPDLAPGRAFVLEGHRRGDQELLLVETHHRLQQPAFMGGGSPGADHDGGYENRFRAIDAKQPFRPARVTPKPHVPGVLTARVEAEQSGQYAETDDEGRYRVRFLFDGSDAPLARASRPIRMAQPHAGPGYGFHFPLRDGVEVLVTCVEGDPDRPIITGAVPNPATPSTVSSKNGTRNVIRTGGGTELNIDDQDDGQRFKISVPYGGTVLQLGAPNAPEKGVYIGTALDSKMAADGHIHLEGGKEIKATTPDTIVNSNTVKIQGSSEVTIGHGGVLHGQAAKVQHTAGSLYQENAPTIFSVAGGVSALKAGAAVLVEGGGSVSVHAPAVTVTGTAITTSGATVTVNGNGSISITGGTVSVDGSTVTITGGSVDIKGGPIKLNV